MLPCPFNLHNNNKGTCIGKFLKNVLTFQWFQHILCFTYFILKCFLVILLKWIYKRHFNTDISLPPPPPPISHRTPKCCIINKAILVLYNYIVRFSSLKTGNKVWLSLWEKMHIRVKWAFSPIPPWWFTFRHRFGFYLNRRCICSCSYMFMNM